MDATPCKLVEDPPVVVLLVDDQAMVGEAVRRALAGHADIAFHYCRDPAEAIATAERVKLEMAQLKNDNEAFLVRAREERAMLLKEAKETKDKIIGEAKEEAKTQAAKIVAEAQITINNQKMAAIVDLKNQIGKLVIEISEKILRRELSEKGEQESFIKQLAEEAKLN